MWVSESLESYARISSRSWVPLDLTPVRGGVNKGTSPAFLRTLCGRSYFSVNELFHS